jgi:ubiquitin carboxyl-terminal hydrolase 7
MDLQAVEPPSYSDSTETLAPSLDSVPVPPGVESDLGLEYKWVISNWSKQRESEKIYSPTFTLGTTEWRILLFPKGNRQQGFISCFLESIDATKENNERFSSCLSFGALVMNPKTLTTHTKISTAQHRFCSKETDWGFSTLCSHEELASCTENDGFVLLMMLKNCVDETGVLWHNLVDWDSYVETGFIGLKNQGATCYLNSLLQSLYYTTYFRKATYCIPTNGQEPTKSVAYALQRLFYHMQFSKSAVGTQELTKAFGWDTMDAFHQHDVQELNRVLQDNLENTMKGTPAEGAIRKLFTGKMKSYIKCLNVDFESSRVEDFYDIQLNVKNCKNIHESFVDYCSIETLDGDNKYYAEGFGLQNAKKGVIFHSFPPVLHLQLKRFDYDMMNDQFIKINDRHEFGMTLDIDDFLDEDADRSIKQHYRLQGY